MGIYRLTAHGFRILRFVAGLLVFTPWIQLIIYVLLIKDPYNFKTLDRFKCSWLVTATDIWNGLPGGMLLQGETYGWHTILRDIQRFVCTWHLLLNQARTGCRLARAWFLRIASVCERLYACVYVCVCVCPPPRLLITSGMMWYDIDPIWLVK